MRRLLLKLLLTLVVALAMAFGVAPGAARAASRASGPAEIGELPAGAPAARARPRTEERGPALVAPQDVPVLPPSFDGRAASIPALPSSYVTKQVGWLELSYPSSAEERVASLIRDADAVKAQLTNSLGQPVLDHVRVRVAPTYEDMARLAPAEAPPPEYASGVSYNGMHFVLLSMLAPRGAEAVDLDEVFRHEMVHVALEDALLGHHVPVWFNEGLAMRLSGEGAYDRTKILWNATLSDTLLPLSELDRSFPRDGFKAGIAYAESADFMGFLTRKSDSLRFAALIDRVRDGQPFERAVTEAYGSELRRLEFEWRGDLEHRFSVIPVLTGGGLVWVLVIGALGYAYVRRRRRSKAILAQWAREEALEDAAIARAEARQAAIAAGASAVGDPTSLSTNAARASASATATAVSVKLEHAGRFHTLH